jgi:hypothetical protein
MTPIGKTVRTLAHAHLEGQTELELTVTKAGAAHCYQGRRHTTTTSQQGGFIWVQYQGSEPGRWA